MTLSGRRIEHARSVKPVPGGRWKLKSSSSSSTLQTPHAQTNRCLIYTPVVGWREPGSQISHVRTPSQPLRLSYLRARQQSAAGLIPFPFGMDPSVDAGGGPASTDGSTSSLCSIQEQREVSRCVCVASSVSPPQEGFEYSPGVSCICPVTHRNHQTFHFHYVTLPQSQEIIPHPAPRAGPSL